MSAFLFKGVEIDVCPKCLGVWLDAGELEKIAALIGQPRETDPSKQNSRLESLEDALDVLDTATDFDPSILDGVLDFVTDALGSIFDGISL